MPHPSLVAHHQSTSLGIDKCSARSLSTSFVLICFGFRPRFCILQNSSYTDCPYQSVVFSNPLFTVLLLPCTSGYRRTDIILQSHEIVSQRLGFLLKGPHLPGWLLLVPRADLLMSLVVTFHFHLHFSPVRLQMLALGGPLQVVLP